LTVSLTFVVWVLPPPVPVMVMVWLPVLAPMATFIVIVDFPEPELMLVGLKVTVTPDGTPDADKEIAELNPPEGVAVIVDVPELVQATLTDVGEALRLKFPLLPAAVTVRDTVVVSVVAPLVPVTVIVYVPVAVDDPTANVNVEVPAPVIEVGLKVGVTPLGSPEADKVTAESNPPKTLLVIVDVPLLPCTTDTELGEAEMVKPGAAAVPARALSRADPFGLPQPVTKS